MKGEIVKTKFLCKAKSQISKGGRTYMKWIDRFVAGKWYDGEYEMWTFESGYRVNGGWRRYWVVNEQGVKEEIPKAIMNAVFDNKISERRDVIIDQILKENKN